MTIDATTSPSTTAPRDLTARQTTPRGTDYSLLSELLTDAEREIRDRVWNFVDTQVRSSTTIGNGLSSPSNSLRLPVRLLFVAPEGVTVSLAERIG